MKRKPIGYLEATVTIPLYEGDTVGQEGPGAWWEYGEPCVTANGALGECKRQVTETSRRLLDAEGKAKP